MMAGRKQWMGLLRWMNVIERLTTKQQWLRWGRIGVILTATALVMLSGVFISSAQAISVIIISALRAKGNNAGSSMCLVTHNLQLTTPRAIYGH